MIRNNDFQMLLSPASLLDLYIFSNKFYRKHKYAKQTGAQITVIEVG